VSCQAESGSVSAKSLWNDFRILPVPDHGEVGVHRIVISAMKNDSQAANDYHVRALFNQ
jgi:hypothetical protein